jgi:DNA-binding transcriptional ArsR family regulator
MSQLETAVSRGPTPEQLDQIALLFKVLGEPMRLRILQTICDAPRHVGEIVELTGATQANVSKHLSLLLQAGVLQRRKDGQRVFYGIRNTLAPQLCEIVCSSLLEDRT